MKNKKTSWILLPAVLLIWGIIGWKIYAATRDNPSADVLPRSTAEVAPEKSDVPDTYRLLLDYPDPFLATSKPVATKPSGTNPHIPKPKISTEPVAAAVWPEIRYAGLVKSPKDGKVVGFLTIDGTSHFVKSGDAIGSVSVKTIWKDSALVGFGKESRTIHK